MSVTFDTISKQYEAGSRNYNPDSVAKNKDSNPAAFYSSSMYKAFMSVMYKGMRKFESGSNKEYYNYLIATNGDYSRRKGGNVYEQMRSHAEFIKQYIAKEGNKNLKNSFLQVYVDLWDILNDRDWKNAFRRAFEYSAKEGDNSIVSSFKFIYIAAIVALESISFKVVNFEFDVHSGINPDKAAADIMLQHNAFMKSVVVPAINLICLCQNTSKPLDVVNQVASDERAMKNKEKAKEAAGLMTEVQSYSVENSFLGWVKSGAKSLYDVFNGLASAGAKSLGMSTVSFVVIFSVAVYLVFFAIPTARLIIYYVNMHKVNMQKELELQAELLNNNILVLQEQLEKTSDEKERIRLQNIISRQIEILAKLKAKIKDDLDDEYMAAAAAEKAIENDDVATGSEVRSQSDSGDSGFAIEI